MTLEYEITFQDFRASQNLRRRKYRMLRIAFQIIFAMPVLFMIYVLIFTMVTTGTIKDILPFYWDFLPLVLLVYIGTPLIRLWNYKKCFAGQYTGRRLRYIFGNDLIEYNNIGFSESKIYWGSVVRVLEDKKLISIYIAKMRFIPIPKRILTETTLAELKEILRQNVPAGVIVP